jgi:hypothetical protein
VRSARFEKHEPVLSADLQTVGVHVRLLYRPKINYLPQLHSKLGPDYDERVLPSLGNEILKAVVVSHHAPLTNSQWMHPLTISLYRARHNMMQAS